MAELYRFVKKVRRERASLSKSPQKVPDILCYILRASWTRYSEFILFAIESDVHKCVFWPYQAYRYL